VPVTIIKASNKMVSDTDKEPLLAGQTEWLKAPHADAAIF
jgi:hypothetical protein